VGLEERVVQVRVAGLLDIGPGAVMVVDRQPRDRPTGADPPDLADISGGFLHRHDVFDCGESLQRCGLDVDARAALHAVDDDRNPNCFRDCALL